MTGKPYSARRRLVRRTLVCMVVILGMLGIGVHQVARHESEEIFSARLATSARVIEALVARQVEKATITQPIVIPLPPELEHATEHSPVKSGHPYETKIAFQVWSQRGTLLAKSATAPDVALGSLAPGFSKNSIHDELWEVFALQSGDVWVLAAEKEEVREEMVRELTTSTLAPLVVGGLLMVLAVNLVLYSGMNSLRTLADRISKREPESLAQIELSGIPEELAPVVNELNSLLGRVQGAFERERRFIDAAAHEIRTPIAAIQLHVQNAMRAETPQERESSLSEAIIGLRRTTKLAEQLLTFSRVAAKADGESFRKVSLNQVCAEIIGLQEPLLEQRGQTIGLEASQECQVMGDPYKLQQLLQNLIDNASLYGAPKGEIEVALAVLDGKVRLQVANDGSSIPDAEIDRIFMPYYRIPGQKSPGSGLGLSIVKEIAGQHKAVITVARKTDDQGSVISLTFPQAGAALPA